MTGAATAAGATTYATYRTLQDFEASVDKIVYIEPRLKVQRRTSEGKPGVVIISEIFVTGMNIAGVPGGVRLPVETPHYEITEAFDLTPQFATAICEQTGAQQRLEKAIKLVEKYFTKRPLVSIGGILKVEGLIEELSRKRHDLDHHLWEVVTLDGGRRFLREPQPKISSPDRRPLLLLSQQRQNAGEYADLLDEILSRPKPGGTDIADETIH